MPKSINITWLKYVHNQRTNNGISIVYLSTVASINNIIINLWCINTYFIQPIRTTYTTLLSTTNNLINNLLNKSFTYNPQYLLMSLLKEN